MLHHKTAKCRGKFFGGLILFNNNSRPHITNAIKDNFHDFRWKVLNHPSYSPALPSCDYHLHNSVKKALKDWRFASDQVMHGTK